MLFSSTSHAIWKIFGVFTYSIESDPFNWSYFIINFGFIITPLIAAIIVGRLSESRIQAFVGFFVAILICMLISIILVFYNSVYQLRFAVTFDQTEAILTVIFGSLVNGLIYGLLAYLTAKNSF
jgi:hypothetical protein